jgi:hypothetical protein
MIRFDNRTTNKDFIGRAITKAEAMLSPDSPLMKELFAKDDFKFDSGRGSEVCGKLVLCPAVAPVYFYRPVNPWTSAMGYSANGEIHFNTRKFNSFSFSDVVGLLLHEYAHVAGFGHGNNFKTKEKVDFSVPYFLSENVARFL